MLTRLTFICVALAAVTLVGRQDDVWIDELSHETVAPVSAPNLLLVFGLGNSRVFQGLSAASRSFVAVAGGGTTRRTATSTGTEAVRCRGGARSWNPDQDITIFADIYLEGQRIDGGQASGYTPSINIVASFASADYDRTVTCELYTGSAWAGASLTIPPLEYPYAVVHTDSGNYWESHLSRWRRDFWLQIYHANGNRWSRGGHVYESFNETLNPCNVVLVDGDGPVNTYGQYPDTFYSGIRQPECAVEADQTHFLSSASMVPIFEGRWRWDTSGVWRR